MPEAAAVPRHQRIAGVARMLLAAGLVATVSTAYVPVIATSVAPSLAALTGLGAARAVTGYTMGSTAEYVVDPPHRRVTVSVEATFTNTTPNPTGRFSVFDSVPFPVQTGASGVTARDGAGPLTVRLAPAANGAVATVTLRGPLRYGRSVTLHLEYALVDGLAPQVRVRPTVVVVPVWGFGTTGTVTVRLPAAYEVQSAGSTLTAASVATDQILSSGPIADPAHWLAVLTATAATTYLIAQRSIALRGGTADLRVRSWSDDAAWGQRTLDLLSQALPLLEKSIGLPYAGVGPLVVTESVPVSVAILSEPQVGAQEMAIAFNASSFTVLHEAAHVWVGPSLAGDRWLQEGLASYAAEAVAQQLKVAVPYAPADEAKRLSASAFPLETWPAGSGSAEQDAWGHAASWAVVDEIVSRTGATPLGQVLQRAAAGIGAYETQPGNGIADAVGRPSAALTARTFLDGLEQASGLDLGTVFVQSVFSPDSATEIPARAEARAAYRQLLAAAGDWGAPAPIRAAMAAWRFEEARADMDAARTWLGERDSLLAAIETDGLATPTRLRDRWLADGGGAPARAELAAERAVVAAYHSVAVAIADGRGPIEWLGLVGESDPAQVLATAAGLYANGNLDAAVDAIEQARALDDGAQAAGVVRLALAAAAAAAAMAAAALATRRVRGWRRSPAQT